MVVILLEDSPHSLHCSKKILGIPASSAKSERVFSVSGNMVTPKTTSLDPGCIEDLVTINCNLQLLEEFEK